MEDIDAGHPAEIGSSDRYRDRRRLASSISEPGIEEQLTRLRCDGSQPCGAMEKRYSTSSNELTGNT